MYSSWYRAHTCRTRRPTTDHTFPWLGISCINSVCFSVFFPHVPVSFLQSGASSYKHRIRPAKRCHAFSLIVEGLHQCFLFLLFMFFPPLFRVKPLHYISWLIGHEGTGSILSVLRKKWVLLPLSVCFSDLRALQNPIKRSSIYWVYMSFFQLRARPECRSPIFKLYTLPTHLTMWFIHSHPWMWLYKSISASCC